MGTLYWFKWIYRAWHLWKLLLSHCAWIQVSVVRHSSVALYVSVTRTRLIITILFWSKGKKIMCFVASPRTLLLILQNIVFDASLIKILPSMNYTDEQFFSKSSSFQQWMRGASHWSPPLVLTHFSGISSSTDTNLTPLSVLLTDGSTPCCNTLLLSNQNPGGPQRQDREKPAASRSVCPE